MEKKKSKIILKIIGILFLLGILVFTYSFLLGTKGLKIKEYKVIDKNLPSEFYGLKIVHFSDIHYGFFFEESDLKNVVQKINSLNPDIVIFSGDLIDIDIDDTEEEKVISLLKEIKPNLGKYIIKGNLDYSSKNYDNIVKESEFNILDDNFDIIYGNNSQIVISGLNSNIINNNIEERLEKTYNYISDNNTNYNILVMHEPDYITKVNKNTFNLVLAGHSHDGQIRLPFIGAIYTPNGSKKYYKNYYETNRGKLYISSGIGTSSIPIRLFNKPSINFYRLTNK